jgi:hypothetical protein
VSKVLEAYDQIAYVGALREETQLLPDIAEEEIRNIASGAMKATVVPMEMPLSQ